MKPFEINILISSKIKLRRQELGMSRRQAITSAGLHANSIYRYEDNPQCKITAVSLYLISKAFGVSMDYFFEEIIHDEKQESKELKVDYEKEEIVYE